MLTTLDKILKACILSRLEIARFKAGKIDPYAVDNFLQEVSNTFEDIEDKVGEVVEEIKR